MEEYKKTQKNESELRQDIVTGDWVIIATGRARRPEDFLYDPKETLDESKVTCPFESLEDSGQEKDTLVYKNENEEWSLRVFPNKYPAVSRARVPKDLSQGPYYAMSGVGYHELIVPRDHDRSMAFLEVYQIAEIFDAFQERYLDLMNKKNINYVSIIHNHGKSAGASIAHPHSQLLAIPAVSPYVKLELDGAKVYKKNNKKCVYCTMIDYEKEENVRVVFENNAFIAFCPFASRGAFEVWVLPKNHSAYYERILDKEKTQLATVFQKIMRTLYKGLNNPDYNFYMHTSPCDGQDYPYYHWHIEILPRTAIWAGFELSTGIEISTIEPEKAAQFLRETLVSVE